ncbi:MAG: biotin transporter BioY [Cyanobacteriota bacterium]
MGKVISLERSNVNEKLKYSRFLNEFPEINLGSLAITFLCIILMIIATFTMLPVGIFNEEILTSALLGTLDINNVFLTLHSYLYSPQVPIAIFAGALLGPRLGTFSMAFYVFLGLIGVPIFAAGGGFDYIAQPVFGFIIGYIIAAYSVGKVFSKNINSLLIIFAALLGVVTVHFFGVTYLIINMLLSGFSFEYIKAWVWGLSLSNLPYDILFSLILCAIARPIRGLLWVTME